MADPMDHAVRTLLPRRIGKLAPLFALVGLVLAFALPARGLAALPGGITPEEFRRYSPRSPEELREVLRRLRAEREAMPGAAARPGIATLPPPGPEDGRWQEWAPPTRAFHAMVVDSRRDRLIVLGGDKFYAEENMWSVPLDQPSQWEPFGAIGAPASWSFIAAVYDSTHDRILAIVTVPESGTSRSALWQLPLSGAPTWSEIVVPGATRPTAGGFPALAFDEAGQRLFMVRPLDGVWELDLAPTPVWSQLGPAPPHLAYYGNPSVVYAPGRDEVLVEQGGEVWRTALGGTVTWSPFWSGSYYSPYGRTAYDPAAGELIVVSSRIGEAYAISLADGSFRVLAAGDNGDDRSGFALAFDAKRQRVLQHGGWGSLGWTTWSSMRALDLVDGAHWSELSCASGGAHLTRSAGLDEGNDRLVSYGSTIWGPNYNVVTRSLSHPETGAVVLEPTGTPRPDTWGESMTYDPARKRMVFYGGTAGGEYVAETWALSMTDPPAWEQLAPAGSGPGPLAFHDAFMDVARDRLVIFGGETSDPSAPPAAWALEFAPELSWKQLVVTGAEDARYLRGLVFDREHGEGWALGGMVEAVLWHVTVGDDTLSFDLVPAIGGPTTEPHDLTGVSFDPVRHRLLVFEEDYFGRRVTSGYWMVDLGGAATWTWKSAGGVQPYPRYSEACVFDATRDRLVMYGGYDDTDHYFDDWWSLNWDRPTPVAASLVTASFERGIAHLAWQLADAAGASVTIERSRERGAWSAIASRLPDGLDRIWFDDADLAPGARYGWRLRVKSAEGERLLGETWLDVPAPATFALRGALRNPVAGDLVVAFSLDRASEATLGLFDLGGRRLAERRVRAEAAGPREVTLARRGEYPPGIYFLRLADGARALSARVVLAN